MKKMVRKREGKRGCKDGEEKLTGVYLEIETIRYILVGDFFYCFLQIFK